MRYQNPTLRHHLLHPQHISFHYHYQILLQTRHKHHYHLVLHKHSHHLRQILYSIQEHVCQYMYTEEAKEYYLISLMMNMLVGERYNKNYDEYEERGDQLTHPDRVDAYEILAMRYKRRKQGDKWTYRHKYDHTMLH